MAKIASIMTDLFEDSEYTSPKEALEAAGHQVVPVGLEKGATVTGKSDGTEVEIEVGIDTANGEDFDALLIPGGYSPDKIRKYEDVLNFVRHFAYKHKPIFTICHGPQLLVNADVLHGKDITAVAQVAVDVKNAGANYFDEEVVIDDSGIISSRTPDDLPAFNKAIVDALK
ncbi:type 1 glutamine amidotransferase domain-containing protein [Aerococcus urinae]|uniref:type 1 glutamine amidotransferase domain-containing protein n=1 Tax=Aerococcus urinae TaxID=1376 RepID=UPI0025518623|nr:type 1 glutamine amidotransferase domain-containing protein [Aerococcus urinae]MDK6371149.1 type 1 glutamine amidotransferase domain-containing protein [Aerococcus urinae]